MVHEGAQDLQSYYQSKGYIDVKVNSLEGIYASGGYSQVKISPNVVNQNGRLQITFMVEEGPQDVVESLRIEGNNSLSPTDFAPQGLKVDPGKPFSQQRMQ